MKKITLLLLTACTILMFGQTNRTSDVTTPVVAIKPIVFKYPTKAFVTKADYNKDFNALNLIFPKVYDQRPFETANITSQKFDAANTQYTANAADDFVVPANKLWTINAVFADGNSPGLLYPTSFNVTFYNNDIVSNLPATVIRTENVVLAAGSSSPTLPLSTPLVLTEGTYWISIQAVADLSMGQWFWSTFTDPGTLGAPFAWTNPGNGFSTPCSTVWNTASICLAGQLKDLQFALDGTQYNPCKTFTGRILNTDPTHSPRITRNGVHSICGTAKPYPGNTGSENFHYKSYTVQNTSASPDCVTLTLKNLDPLNTVHLVAYIGSFNPSNLSQNYLGDIGNSSVSGKVETFSVTIPGNTTIVLIATEPTANSTYTKDYTINVLSENCASILKTGEISGKNVNIYPNPVNTTLFVNGMNVKEAKVFDASGKLIPAKVNGNTIDTQKIPKGNYILKMEDKEGKSTTRKFIKK